MSLMEDISQLILRPFFTGNGVVLMFHRVLENKERSPFDGLRGLEIRPDLYVEVLKHFERRRFHFLSTSALADHIKNKQLPEKFVVVTFDDGYKDNLDRVADIMTSNRWPWTLYITTGFCDRTLPCWWYGLGRLLERTSQVDARPIAGGDYRIPSASQIERNNIYNELRAIIHQKWNDKSYQDTVSEWFKGYGIDLLQITDELAMTWNDIRSIESSGCEIGAHTIQHLNLKNSEKHLVVGETRGGKVVLEEKLGHPVRTFAYPFGDIDSCGEREFEIAGRCGFDLAFTTRNAWLKQSHVDQPLNLPRINVSGTWDSLSSIMFRVNGWSYLREVI